MKRISGLMAAVIMISVILTAGAQSHVGCRYDEDRTFRSKNIDLEDGVLVIEHEDGDWTVEITEDYELYIDGRRIKTDRQQKKLLRRYYDDYGDIEEMAEEIGKEAAEIGIAGAKLGVKAVACLAKVLLEDYDREDMEDEIEIDSKDLEKMTDKIEKRAEKIEDLADDLEKTHRKLRRSIPQLGELEDF